MTYYFPPVVRLPTPRTAVEFISTASSSTVSGLLTLFPKCFSSFLHSTCSLSVSCQYLALEGIYLPLRAAFPNNPTRRTRAVKRPGQNRRGSHPLRRCLPATLQFCRPQIARLHSTSPCGNRKDSHAGLFPVHSPLLRES